VFILLKQRTQAPRRMQKSGAKRTAAAGGMGCGYMEQSGCFLRQRLSGKYLYSQLRMQRKQLRDELRLYRPLPAPGLQSPHDMHERTTERLPEQYLLCDQLRLRGQRLL